MNGLRNLALGTRVLAVTGVVLLAGLLADTEMYACVWPVYVLISVGTSCTAICTYAS